MTWKSAMDLVDIDKVLDNLELNEEQNKEEVPAIKQMQILNSSGLPSHIASGSLNETPQNTTFGQTTPNSICDQVNRFVGMSQVFSSLDVYRKNVEFLNTGECNNNTNNKFEHLENIKTDTKADSEHTHSICEEEVEEDPCTDDEINKFVSADEYGQSSNSITTSSSSTFSSGPSPALISTESDNSFDIKQEVKGISKEHDKQSAAFDKIDNTKSSSNQGELNKDLHERSEYDDLAVGLSSISLTQHGSSLSSEISSSKCISKSDILSSILSLSETAEISEELPSKPKDSLEVANPHKPKSNIKNSESDIEEKNNSAHHATVTFGWTVDEISDTELESILQEIDMEMSSDLPEHVRNLTQEQSSAGSDELKALVDKDKLENPSSSDHKKKANSEMGASSWMGEVWRNSDSSSQASTIEFAEVRAHEDEIDYYKNGNKICDVDGEELNDAKQGVSLKRQRPTTLDLPVKKINLYATAGQTPPGLQIHDQLTSSSEEDTPEFKDGLVKSTINVYFNDDAGHTPPELSDKSDFGADETKAEVDTTSNYDETMLNQEGMPSNLDIETTAAESTYVNTLSSVGETTNNLGKVPPIWVPDQEANACMQCQQKFTLLKRRHHCRACGQVLCSVCCSQKFKLEFLSNLESRVCVQCFLILSKLQQQKEQQSSSYESVTSYPVLRTPNPNNPMEYCSKIPPYRQVNSQPMSYPTVIVPVGVLKKEGNTTKSRKRKSVMFSDGIRPGSDLASLDRKWSDAKHARKSTPSNSFASETAGCTPRSSNNQFFSRNDTKSLVGDSTSCFKLTDDKTLPPIVVSKNSEILYEEVENNAELIKRLQTESVKFLINANFYVHVRIVHLKCCINKTVINFTTCGLYNVGNDEIIILLELDDSNEVPKDIFVYLNEIYWEASKGHPITELTFSMPKDVNFLGSREHGGFLFIRSTFQCLIDVHVPNTPFLIGLLIHRWEVPWAKIFPLRLMLRLGAQYRYYPSPHISVREREPVYADIAQTIINLLADFRNYTYTLPTVKGLYIHMEERKTNILIPRNRHDDVIKAIKNSSDHILALGANFSKKADGHLVCIQNLKSESSDSNSYSTQAINIQGQPRKVTGASFFVLNEALKSTSGLSGKCSIIEDGLMVQILPSKMIDVRNALINMKDIDIVCGPIEAEEQQTEVVYIQWVDDDTEINKGVISPVDSRKMDGIPSIRVHSGVSLSNTYHILKWTEVFLIEVGSKHPSCKGAVDVSKVSEKIAKNASVALLPFLELLVANGSNTIGLRVNLNSDSVSYEAGSQNEKLPPLYMNALDNELIPTLHKLASEIGNVLVLELIFHILKENINLSKM